MPSPDSIIPHKENKHTHPNHAAPIHPAGPRIRRRGKELKDPKHRQKAQRNNIDRIAGRAEVESGRRELFAAQSLPEDAWSLVSSHFKAERIAAGTYLHAMQMI